MTRRKLPKLLAPADFRHSALKTPCLTRERGVTHSQNGCSRRVLL